MHPFSLVRQLTRVRIRWHDSTMTRSEAGKVNQRRMGLRACNRLKTSMQEDFTQVAGKAFLH